MAIIVLFWFGTLIPTIFLNSSTLLNWSSPHGCSDIGVTMWRSSQPKSGVSGACTADEKLLDLIAQSCVYKRTPLGGLKIVGDPLLCIVDCRPKVSFNVESYHLLPCLPFFYSKFWPHLNLRDQEYQLTQVLHLTVYFLPLLIILICLVKDSILHAA